MASLAQDAFHRLGPRSCDREMLLRVHLTFARWSFAPFHPPRAGSALSGSEPPWRATSRHLGSPLGSPWSRVEDAPRRLLQPTHDTSTRGSPDSRARRLAPRRPPPSLAQALSSQCCGRLRRQPAPSPRGENGDPAPGGARLTARSPASVHSTTSRVTARRFWRRVDAEGSRSKAGATSPRRCRPRGRLVNDL